MPYLNNAAMCVNAMDFNCCINKGGVMGVILTHREKKGIPNRRNFGLERAGVVFIVEPTPQQSQVPEWMRFESS